MIVNIQPSFYCNQTCNYCYLGCRRQEKILLDLNLLTNRLEELKSNHYPIEHIDLYGGELGLLDEGYLKELFSLCYLYTDSISAVTNLSNNKVLNLLENFPKLQIGLSWNKERPLNNKVEGFLNIGKNLDNISLLIVVLPSILKMDKDFLLEKLNNWNIPVTFLRYFPSVLNPLDFKVNKEDFSLFLRGIIKKYYNNGCIFDLTNINLLNTGMDMKMSSHIFIMPNSEYSWVGYTSDNKEIYYHSYNLSDWQQACYNEKSLINLTCLDCKYYNKCLAEHYNINEITGNTCCGLKDLLEWWNEKNLYKNY